MMIRYSCTLEKVREMVSEAGPLLMKETIKFGAKSIKRNCRNVDSGCTYEN